MDVICYVCNEETRDWHRNLVETKSKHTKTPIVTFIVQFLDDYVSQRNVRDESNCICSECLRRIYTYDWMCLKVKEQEKELRTLILKSETSFTSNQIKSEFEFVNPTEMVQVDYDQEDYDDIKTESMNADDSPDDIVTIEEIKIDPDTVGESIPDDDDDDCDDDDDFSDDDDNAVDSDEEFVPKVSSMQKKQPKKAPVSTTASNNCLNSKICEICGEKLKHETTIRSHIKIHTKSPGMFTCHVCLYEVSDKEKDKFKDHVRKHTKITSKQCVICNEGGTENFDLKHHVRSQHNTTLSCDTCGKSFVYASVLRLHLRSHIENLPEKCEHCKKSFPDKITLEEHMKTHVQAVCTFCGKKFTRKQKCKKHELRHTNESKKFKCSLCPAALDTERGLKLHSLRKHNGDKDLNHKE
ncbi:zinc finger protein 569-like [Sitodiplosis mosellana]|uniref:zinc finger protein 569-like n=1 Tax=Sitodiplosis mosellana TaxID=263140 RepID=UPI002443D395|nr:zinc finger protein 569-like [Sitodiplosis mosellana]